MTINKKRGLLSLIDENYITRTFRGKLCSLDGDDDDDERYKSSIAKGGKLLN